MVALIIEVMISMVSLFLRLDLDFLCAIRTPRWKNPAERVMSLLNVALQGAGISRRETSFEDQLKACNNTKQIRSLAAQVPGLKEAVIDSLEAPKSLLCSLFTRLKLKEPLHVFHASSDQAIDDLWKEIHKVDETLSREDTTVRLILPKKKLQAFFDTHCTLTVHV